MNKVKRVKTGKWYSTCSTAARWLSKSDQMTWQPISVRKAVWQMHENILYIIIITHRSPQLTTYYFIPYITSLKHHTFHFAVSSDRLTESHSFPMRLAGLKHHERLPRVTSSDWTPLKHQCNLNWFILEMKCWPNIVLKTQNQTNLKIKQKCICSTLNYINICNY